MRKKIAVSGQKSETSSVMFASKVVSLVEPRNTSGLVHSLANRLSDPERKVLRTTIMIGNVLKYILRK